MRDTERRHRPDVPIVHDHDKSYYAHASKKSARHVDRSHHRDLFDFDDPQTDSDYDDMDEETGIYHDDDPHAHPAQRVRHQYSDDQYYRSRERYFPEDSYHAAGQMKFAVESVEDLTAHAIGKREKKEKAEAEKAEAEKAEAEKAAKAAPSTPVSTKQETSTKQAAVAPSAEQAKPADVAKAEEKFVAPPPPYAPGDPAHPF